MDSELGRQGAWFRGFFVAPRSGVYNFRASQDDSLVAYMNLNADTSDTSTMTKIIDNCAYT
jgi:hypothetical protein